jgi:hypothetical protein
VIALYNGRIIGPYGQAAQAVLGSSQWCCAVQWEMRQVDRDEGDGYYILPSFHKNWRLGQQHGPQHNFDFLFL